MAIVKEVGWGAAAESDEEVRGMGGIVEDNPRPHFYPFKDHSTFRTPQPSSSVLTVLRGTATALKTLPKMGRTSWDLHGKGLTGAASWNSCLNYQLAGGANL